MGKMYYGLKKSVQSLLSIALYLSLAVSLSSIDTALAAAPNNQLLLSPNSSSMNVNSPITLLVRSYVDTAPSGASTASGTVTYPTSQLRVSSVSTAGSKYSLAQPTQGSGTISFSASTTDSSVTTGIYTIFSITFVATSSGTATVNFSDGSSVNGVTLDSSHRKTSILTITNPNPVTTVPPSTTPKPSTVATPPVSSAPVVSNTPPTSTDTSSSSTDTSDQSQTTPDPTGLIDNVAINPLYTSASVTWKVNGTNPALTFHYGDSANQLDKTASASRNGDGSGTYSVGISGLSAGVRYYFSISATADGGKTGAYSGVIVTRGFPVAMTITENNVAAKNALVKIGGLSYSTNSEGKLTIGLASGSYTGTITSDTASLNISFTVTTKPIPSDGTAPASQPLSYNLSSSVLRQGPGSGISILGFIGVMVAGMAVLGIGFLGFMAYRRRQFESGSVSPRGSSSTVIVEDGYNWRESESSQPQDPLPKPQLNNQPNMPLPAQHQNSVHITDEEPVDMFDQVESLSPPPNDVPNSNDQIETEQNSSPLHSTKP